MAKASAKIEICGIVQGVGFRPFVHKRAEEFSLSGKVLNTSSGVSLILEGEKTDIDGFLDGFRDAAPSLALIEDISITLSDTVWGYNGFEISESAEALKRRTLISPDIATCDDCLRELFARDGRRRHFPFINCTNCGPRFTIIRDIPYDRKNTTMESFSMCDACNAEYVDIADRRYHAEPTCCDACGPRLFFLDRNGDELAGDAIKLCESALLRGEIVAIKGLGGVHLACLAEDAALARTLRTRKGRDEKPFAIMCRDLKTAHRFAEISAEEEKLLTSAARPIVLLKKKNRRDFSHISENGYIGIMLPYTPVHHMLFSGGISSLIMTSANISELPIIYKDEEIVKNLGGIADGYLLNNRDIHLPCDDSLVWERGGREYFVRRSRGYVPYPITVKEKLSPILACGAEQKATFALSRENHVFLSQHMGDLKNLETLENFEEQISHFEKIFDISPRAIVSDLHPDYLSTQYAAKRADAPAIPHIRVWHHHAHMASCMADNSLSGKCIGIVWDGVGLSPDGDACGCEFIVGDYKTAHRAGTMLSIPLPGGDRATREVFRTGISLLLAAGVAPTDFFGEESDSVTRLLSSGINCTPASGMGRLFDGVAAILGIKRNVSYEGQAAMLLEAAADESVTQTYPFEIKRENDRYFFDWRKMIRAISEDVRCKTPTEEISAAFMNTLVAFACDMTKLISDDTKLCRVVLSGGSFQNMYILKRLSDALSENGFEVYTHRRTSTNDEGLALGQIMIANEGGGNYVSCNTARNSGN
ncbi:MAG: carbamoyltransferase HypF [Oscillospiraceae bacterium]|nr:carbamoyltransferase HypF [Oscillospiraceae bacterium]